MDGMTQDELRKWVDTLDTLNQSTGLEWRLHTGDWTLRASLFISSSMQLNATYQAPPEPTRVRVTMSDFKGGGIILKEKSCDSVDHAADLIRATLEDATDRLQGQLEDLKQATEEL
jgi:hypothetical protein